MLELRSIVVEVLLDLAECFLITDYAIKFGARPVQDAPANIYEYQNGELSLNCLLKLIQTWLLFHDPNLFGCCIEGLELFVGAES